MVKGYRPTAPATAPALMLRVSRSALPVIRAWSSHLRPANRRRDVCQVTFAERAFCLSFVGRIHKWNLFVKEKLRGEWIFYLEHIPI